MEAVKGAILAGGEGTRLRPLSFYFQKCMIPVGSRQKPFLEFPVRLMAAHNLRQIVLLVGYKAEQILNYFGDGARFGVQIKYVYDGDRPRGTGGSLVAGIRSGAFKGAGSILIYYGDVISNLDLTAFVSYHRQGGYASTIALSEDYRVPVGVARLNGSRVVGFEEKPQLRLPVSIGVLIIDTRVLPKVLRLAEGREISDIMGDVIPNLVKSGERVGAFITNDFWYDIGSIERYEKLDSTIIDDLDLKLDQRLNL